jgi:endonuclease YncB( thermonuclease family)
VDGDTIEIRGRRIRIYGIDAPESAQLCEAERKQYRCGQRAALALSDYLGARTVECRKESVDQWQRVVARCAVGTEDVGAYMVREGWAIAYRKYSTEYARLEGEAQAARRRLWAGTFQQPEEWRRQRR